MFNRNIRNTALDREIDLQGHLCIYCNLPFGSVVRHRLRTHIILAVGDHFVPWAFSGQSDNTNFVVACDICNRIKSDKHFDDLISVSRFVLQFRMENKYVTQFIPDTPVTLDYREWQREYSAWLSGE